MIKSTVNNDFSACNSEPMFQASLNFLNEMGLTPSEEVKGLLEELCENLTLGVMLANSSLSPENTLRMSDGENRFEVKDKLKMFTISSMLKGMVSDRLNLQTQLEDLLGEMVYDRLESKLDEL